jgi:AbrB family looped-hinge helix DNA binding protein
MQVLESKLSPEGRVSIPADIRRQLGLEPGDRVIFLTEDDGTVRLVTPRWLAEQAWAANTGGDAVDAVELVRSARAASTDPDRQDRWQEEPAENLAQPSGEDVLAMLFPTA